MARNLKGKANGPGHNSGGMIDGSALNSYINRVVRLMEERKELNEAIAEIVEQAKEAGFVGKQVRQLARERMMEPEVLNEHLSQMDTLRHALAGFITTPLGEAAVQSAEHASE